jgi:hypothetical protein
MKGPLGHAATRDQNARTSADGSAGSEQLPHNRRPLRTPMLFALRSYLVHEKVDTSISAPPNSLDSSTRALEQLRDFVLKTDSIKYLSIFRPPRARTVGGLILWTSRPRDLPETRRGLRSTSSLPLTIIERRRDSRRGARGPRAGLPLGSAKHPFGGWVAESAGRSAFAVPRV